MSFTVVISRAAREEIADAAHWIFQRSPDAAMKWLDGMEQTIAELNEFPTLPART